MSGCDDGTTSVGGVDGGGDGGGSSKQSLCGPEIAGELSAVLTDNGLQEYSFTEGSSDGSDCTFATLYQGEHAASRTLRVVLTDLPNYDECKFEYQMDSDSYSACPNYEVYWSFCTEEFNGNTNRLAAEQSETIHRSFWYVINQALDAGPRPSDVEGDRAAQAEAEAQAEEDAARDESRNAERDDNGCLTADALSVMAGGWSVTAEGGAVEAGCSYAIDDLPGATLTVTETETGNVYEEGVTDWLEWTDIKDSLHAEFEQQGGKAGLGAPNISDRPYAEWDTAIAQTNLTDTGVFVTATMEWGPDGFVQEHYDVADAVLKGISAGYDN
jgi:hypothetical protein